MQGSFATGRVAMLCGVWRPCKRQRGLWRELHAANLHYGIVVRLLLLAEGIEPNPGPVSSAADDPADSGERPAAISSSTAATPRGAALANALVDRRHDLQQPTASMHALQAAADPAVPALRRRRLSRCARRLAFLLDRCRCGALCSNRFSSLPEECPRR
jgi:hypothetical protein